jgi:hypothetical protein
LDNVEDIHGCHCWGFRRREEISQGLYSDFVADETITLLFVVHTNFPPIHRAIESVPHSRHTLVAVTVLLCYSVVRFEKGIIPAYRFGGRVGLLADAQGGLTSTAANM